MAAYIVRRILLMIPTLFGIMLLSFVIIQFAPGGPVEQAIARMSNQDGSTMATVTGGAGDLIVQITDVGPKEKEPKLTPSQTRLEEEERKLLDEVSRKYRQN